jgi:hypothetical protein
MQGRVINAKIPKLSGEGRGQQVWENLCLFEQPLETGQIAHSEVSLSGRTATKPRQVKRKQIRRQIHVYD